MARPIGGTATAIDIAISGMRAESMRSKIIANNIANARTTKTDSGEPFRRLEMALTTADGELNGVTLGEVFADMVTPFQMILSPGHPYADANGYVRYPNVQIPRELMHMMDASRAYQANAAVLKRQMEINNVSLELLR